MVVRKEWQNMGDFACEHPVSIEPRYRPDARLILFHGDVSDFLRQIPDESVQLIITSPPYNLGKAYETKVSIDDYLQAQAQVIAQLYRALRPDGSLDRKSVV